MKHQRLILAKTLVLAAIALPAIACGQAPVDPDPNGVLLKPIPDRLVVLTFDDGCASGYTVAAPILKSLGFNATFYVCDFDSFKTRKDWYMTWRQMKELDRQGFEIGNHTVGHAGSLSAFLAMEDELFANGGPRMTTVCWPLYGAAWPICPELAANGYLFGRGGHERPYRPTVDNPFDVPSFTIRDGPPIENFIKQAQQACQGRVVVFTFHGVPDMEHQGVSLEPATFKVMMQYLKDNNYQVIAMRDLAKYIDPIKAAKLPPTANDAKDAPPFQSVKGDKPYVAVAADAMRPVAANQPAVRTAKDMLAFLLPGPASTDISGTRIRVVVPPATDVTALAPTFTLSPSAVAVPVSGTVRDFSKPQTYTITAQDGSTQDYTVTVVKGDTSNAFVWSKAEAGNWSDASKWTGNRGAGSAPDAAGKPDCILTFNMVGDYAVTNDLSDGFQLNRLNLAVGQGHGMKLTGKPLAFTGNKAAGKLPGIDQHAIFSRDRIDAPVILTSDVAVNLVPAGKLIIGGLISGPGALIYTGGNGNANDDLNGGPNQHYSGLSIEHPSNTYSGGTVINGGTLRVPSNRGLGTGPVTLNDGGGFVPGSENATNPLILNGGTIDAGGVDWNAPITLNGNVRIAGHRVNFNNVSGGMSGPGGFTQIGTWVAFGRANVGEVYLWGANSYSGRTIVQQGTLYLKKAAALYQADPAQWTPAKISVHPAATLVVSAGGPGEFTGAHVGILLDQLTKKVANSGLMGRAVLCVDTAQATGPVTVSADISDSDGPGGGAFVLKKSGAGTLELGGTNTYTGRTILEAGELRVTSLNSVVKGLPGSSLGAPKDIEAGEIVFGSEGKDGDCAFVYAGAGETSDRVINLLGKSSTVTIDQSGRGLLKLTSDLLISGYGANKVVVLQGDTAGAGEFAGAIADPYDRAGKATTSIIKTGKGSWTLSGTNRFSGPLKVTQGSLSLANARSLGDKAEIDISKGASLDLSFQGEMRVGRICFDGKPLPSGTYDAGNAPEFIKGKGRLKF